MIHFEIEGDPMTQGSKSAVMVGGKARVIEGRRTAGRNRHKAWRNAVRDAAADVAQDEGTLDGPLWVSIVFRLPMPKSRKAADRHRGWKYADRGLDLDKLARSVGDSLTDAGLIKDDSRISLMTLTKIEVTGWTGCTIAITRVAQDDLSPPQATDPIEEELAA